LLGLEEESTRMKRLTQVLGFVVAVLALGGCVSGPSSVEPGAQQPGKLDIKDERVLQGPPCSVEDPGVCPEGTTCASLDLASGRRSLCVDPKAICEQLACASGQCVTMESYPIQVRCAP
jgi:hypothetical protein